jgi:hypothetical protein
MDGEDATPNKRADGADDVSVVPKKMKCLSEPE